MWVWLLFELIAGSRLICKVITGASSHAKVDPNKKLRVCSRDMETMLFHMTFTVMERTAARSPEVPTALRALTTLRDPMAATGLCTTSPIRPDSAHRSRRTNLERRFVWIWIFIKQPIGLPCEKRINFPLSREDPRKMLVVQGKKQSWPDKAHWD